MQNIPATKHLEMKDKNVIQTELRRQKEKFPTASNKKGPES